VIECAKALFGDPTFSPYLWLAPEKHYTNDFKDVQVYHDMHTEKWWWCTQVRLLFPMESSKFNPSAGRTGKGEPWWNNYSNSTFNRKDAAHHIQK
jgi:Plavaka transposase